MSDLNDVIKALRRTADEIDQRIPEILLGQEITAKSLIQDRIQETGKDSKGAQLGNYSDTKLPPFFFIGKGTKATDAKLQTLAKEGKKISYKEFRKLDGKQGDYVDLTFSGKMWRETGVVKQGKQGQSAVIVIGQKTERSQKIAGYNEERYGNYLSLSDEELEILAEDVAAEVEDIINKNLNGL